MINLLRGTWVALNFADDSCQLSAVEIPRDFVLAS
jgi:hypothetical protein